MAGPPGSWHQVLERNPSGMYRCTVSFAKPANIVRLVGRSRCQHHAYSFFEARGAPEVSGFFVRLFSYGAA
eukprot:6202540-Pleurochrysis_carterae.AAC.3